jgi:glycosyltransferase involved in cell wall biosynthesis
VSQKGSLKVSIRKHLAKVKVLRKIYKIVGHLTLKKRDRQPYSFHQLTNQKENLHLQKIKENSRAKIFVVVPYFLEMNGPSSHYGNLLEICKQLPVDVSYIATEKNFLSNMNTSQYREFKDINLVDPSNLNILFSGNAIIINCGSPWIYQNIDALTENGSLVIDYLFNHVGHTRNNLYNREKIFHTVCQHQRLLQILQESTNDDSRYSRIPIPFPTAIKTRIQTKSESITPLWVGRLSHEKGVERLVDIALEYFRKTGMPIRVIGGGPMIRELESGIRDGSINYLGELTHAQTLVEIASSKVVINTSFIEGVSLVAMESLAQEVFVISFDVGGMSELLWHPYMRVNHGSNQDFINLLLSVEKCEPPEFGRIPKEFLRSSHEKTWRNLLNAALESLS